MIPFTSLADVGAWWKQNSPGRGCSVLIDWLDPELGVQRREIRALNNTWVVGFPPGSSLR